nr:unnamed protein product [Callosobruchus chinensis]
MDDESIKIACAAFIVISAGISKKPKRKFPRKRRYWMTQLFESRSRYNGKVTVNINKFNSEGDECEMRLFNNLGKVKQPVCFSGSTVAVEIIDIWIFG